MRLNIYIRDEDQEIVEKCKELLELEGNNLSKFLSQTMIDFVHDYDRDPMKPKGRTLDEAWEAIRHIQSTQGGILMRLEALSYETQSRNIKGIAK